MARYTKEPNDMETASHRKVRVVSHVDSITWLAFAKITTTCSRSSEDTTRSTCLNTDYYLILD